MFDFLKSSPVKKLKKQYNQKLEDAMLAQRKGDIRAYATLTAEAEALWSEIETLEKNERRWSAWTPTGHLFLEPVINFVVRHEGAPVII